MAPALIWQIASTSESLHILVMILHNRWNKLSYEYLQAANSHTRICACSFPNNVEGEVQIFIASTLVIFAVEKIIILNIYFRMAWHTGRTLVAEHKNYKSRWIISKIKVFCCFFCNPCTVVINIVSWR